MESGQFKRLLCRAAVTGKARLHLLKALSGTLLTRSTCTLSCSMPERYSLSHWSHCWSCSAHQHTRAFAVVVIVSLPYPGMTWCANFLTCMQCTWLCLQVLSEKSRHVDGRQMLCKLCTVQPNLKAAGCACRSRLQRRLRSCALPTRLHQQHM